MKKYTRNNPPHSIWTNPIHFIACGFGVGSIPFAPGTFGTLAAIPIYLVFSEHLSLLGYLCATLLYTLIAVYCIARTDKDWKTHDHGATVSDEIVGFLVSMIAIPATWPTVIGGFILFRLFDIFKPWPINWIDKHVGGGWGVVLDDVLAGVYTWLVLRIWIHTGWY